jgi:hypothetical protein
MSGVVQTGGDDSEEACLRSKFSYKTLGLRSGDSRVSLGTTVQRIKHFAQESSFFALE